MQHTSDVFSTFIRSINIMQRGRCFVEHPDFPDAPEYQILEITDEDRRVNNFTVDKLIDMPGRKMVLEILNGNFVETGKVVVFYDMKFRIFTPTADEIESIRRAPTWLHEDTLHANFRWDVENETGAKLLTEYVRPSGHALCRFQFPEINNSRNLDQIPGDSSDDEDIFTDDDTVFLYFWHPIILDVEADRAQNTSPVVFPYFPDVPALQPFETPRLFSKTPTNVLDLYSPPEPPPMQFKSNNMVSFTVSARTEWLETIAAACVAPGPIYLIVHRNMTTTPVDASTFFATITLWSGRKHLFQWNWPVWVFADVHKHQVSIGGGYVSFYTRYNVPMKSIKIFQETETDAYDRKRMRMKSLYV